MWWAPLIAAGASIAGGIMSNSANRANAQEQAALQEEFAKNAIQWKVEDAKAAGVHPLYALGANTVSYSPTMVGDSLGPAMAEAGQRISQTFERPTSDLEKQKSQMDMALAAAQLGESDARRQYYLSLAAKERQQDQHTGLGLHQEGAIGSGIEGQTVNPPGMGVYNVKAAEVTTTKTNHPEMSAGTNPAFEERMLDKNLPMIMPRAEGDSPEEILSEMSWPAYVGLLLKNKQEYGPEWLTAFLNSRYFGKKSDQQFKRAHERGEEYGPPKPSGIEILPGYIRGQGRHLRAQTAEYLDQFGKAIGRSERR